MPHDPYKALYLHIPYCVKRCAYCDFTTWAVKCDSKEIDAFIEDLCMDIRRKAKEGELAEIETVYIGGGTPSYIGQRRLSQLLYMLGVSMHLTPEVECTMEANPDSLTEEMVKDIWALGVNRLSIGVQSFDPEVLKTLDRAHTAEQAIVAVRAAQTRFERISIDLMCGIPGQSAESFADSIRQAIELDVPHVSIYPLTIEQGTPFHKLMKKGKLPWPDEDVEADQMELAERLLTEAGYERYEVASYAKPGFECRHNISYWTGVPYLGLGTSAVTMTQNSERRMRVQDGRITDDILPNEMAAEDLMLGMRMAKGVSDELVNASSELLPDVHECFQWLVDLGLAYHADGRFRPTKLGWLCGNELYGRILDLAFSE